MGVALFLVWRRGLKRPHVKKALILFDIQLVLNIAWSAAFFGLKSPFAGLIIISVLWIAIFLTIRYFYNVSLTAARLLIPYILWVSFAAILNLSIFILNKG